MKSAFTVFLSFILFIFSETSNAQDSETGLQTVVVDFADNIANFFIESVRQFDQFTDSEVRKQLIRKVDKLKKDLYKLEIDKEALIESIPDANPDIVLIKQNIQDLNVTLDLIRKNLKDIGAQMREEQGREIEKIVRESTSERTKGLDKLLNEINSQQFNPDSMRATLTKGKEAVYKAQEAVTDFYKKLKTGS